MSEPLRVLLVDDQALVRAGLQRLLSPADGFAVVGECGDGAEALEALTRLERRPDVVCMDVRMRGMDGVEATRRIGELDDPPPVLVLTTFDDDEILWGAVEAGAAGFILKEASAEDLIRAVRTVALGGSWLDPQVTPRVLAAYRRDGAPRQRRGAELEQLTAREREVLVQMATGATNAEIARTLVVSEATVKSHVGNVFMKLGCRDRAAAIVFAFEHGVARRER
ncbi:MAG: response regulator [Thermoleophilia bacterium]